MGKRIYFGFALLIGFFLGGLYASKASDNICQPLSDTLEQASQYAQDNQLEKADQLIVAANEKWDKYWNRLAIIADHAPMDEINGLFAQAKTYLQTGAREDFAATCSRLSQLISAVSDAHKLTWWNLM